MRLASATFRAFVVGILTAPPLAGGCSSSPGSTDGGGGDTDAAVDSGAEASASTEPVTLLVATFNVRRAGVDQDENAWDVRRERAGTLLEARAPDVIGLQEALPEQRSDLLARLPGYDAYGDGRLPDRTGEQVTLLWRTDRFERLDGGTFWLSETPEEPGSVGWDGLFPRICTWARFGVRERDETFFIFNVHLENDNCGPTTCSGAEARLEGARLALTRIAERDPAAPVVLVGDFNAPEGSDPIALVSNDLVDAFRTIHPDDANAGTFHVFAGITDGPRIDYIFTSPDVTVLDAAVWSEPIDGGFVSDHHPVGAELQLPLR